MLEIRILVGSVTEVYWRAAAAAGEDGAAPWRGKRFPPSRTVVDILTAAFAGGDDPAAWSPRAPP